MASTFQDGVRFLVGRYLVGRHLVGTAAHPIHDINELFKQIDRITRDILTVLGTR